MKVVRELRVKASKGRRAEVYSEILCRLEKHDRT